MHFDWRPGAYAVITREQHVLLSLWQGPRFALWTLPGGGIEFGEDPAETCRREVFEETGYHINVGELFSATTDTIPATKRLAGQVHPLMVLRLIFHAEITSGTLTPEVGGSSVDAAWLPIETLHSTSSTGGHQVSEWVFAGLQQAGVNS